MLWGSLHVVLPTGSYEPTATTNIMGTTAMLGFHAGVIFWPILTPFYKIPCSLGLLEILTVALMGQYLLLRFGECGYVFWGNDMTVDMVVASYITVYPSVFRNPVP